MHARTPRRLVVASVLGALLACAPGCVGDSNGDAETGGAEAAESGPGPEEPVGTDSAEASSSVRVMSFNIKYGAIAGLDLGKIAAVINASTPDLVALQEVDDGTRRSGRRAETDELATKTGLRYRYFGANFDYDGGRYGVAILSKYPLSNTRVIRLDAHTGRGNGYEPRIAAAGDVTIGGKRATFVTIHASLHESERDDNARALLLALGSSASRAIVAGDFNERQGGSIGDALDGAGFADAYRERHPWARGYTAPADSPARRIDFIFRGRAFGSTKHAWVPSTLVSDHRPVAAVIPLD